MKTVLMSLKFFSFSKVSNLPLFSFSDINSLTHIWVYIFYLHIYTYIPIVILFYMCVCVCVCEADSVVSNSLWPHGLFPTRFLCPWDSPGKNTGVGCHVILQGIFPIQGRTHVSWSSALQVNSLPLSHQKALCFIMLSNYTYCPIT